ncbi:uncharacterized protein TRIADDRAFT_31422 [Trichoplax adhaerens]|uniref:Cytochrome P450 n=1 Tax=Trichoplax adhaerens TaxID=10228 RepID=B3S932_TRIAD|nr:hypothetical protein TRIADDRAFT_31422 [Trichoplax adhaerens]EDV20730.1 hypothetical protein TRIADDRAFT_31422 [Trichoplax adhaerens]|eukprot:XP_002116671.1 hypothetical protein TRIADDRAFT_31422 [Trichoplax adhaerens]
MVISSVFSVIIKRRKYISQYFRIRKALQHFPGPKPHWLFGNIFQLGKPNENRIKLIHNHVKKYDKCYTYWFGIFPVLICSHRGAAKSIIKASVPKESWIGNWMRPWLGHGLILASGKRWARNRKLLTSVFHFHNLKSYLKVYNECANVLVNKWRQYADMPHSFDEHPDIKMLSFDIILQCVFSVKTDCQINKTHHPYLTAVQQLTRLVIDRVLTLHHYIDWIYLISTKGKRYYDLCDAVHSFADQIIQKRVENLRSHKDNKMTDQQKHKRIDFIDILLTARDETGQGLKLREIRDEAHTFMFAGYDTTASALGWTLYCLAKYGEHQTKVREEIDVIFKDKDDVEWDDLSSLTYTTMCIKEAMRLYTTVPSVERKLNRDMTIDNKFVPAGTTVRIYLHALCNREDTWENPTEFVPQRFNTENSKLRDPYDYMPFSAGHRNCIGKHFALNEMKVAVSKILHHYELEIDHQRLAKRYHAIVSQPENGLWIKIKNRQRIH